jgi:transcription elongation factor Elf1
MIRIKCPKCSTSLTLDDDEAGQVGECTDCGAKFRVPARKAAAPVRVAKGDAVKKRPPARADDDDAEDRDDEPRQAAPKRKPQGMSEAVKANLVMACVFLVAIVVLGTGGIFINNLAVLVTGISVLLMLVTGLLAARGASGSTGKLSIAGFGLLAVVSAYAYMLHEERVVEKRKATKERIGNAEIAVVREYRDA